MTDFINYPSKKPMKKQIKVEITESTKEFVKDELNINVEESSDENQLVEEVNKTKKAVAKRTKAGVKIKRALNG